MSKPLTRKVKDNRGNDHEVYKWFWMKGWEFYQTEPADEFGVTFGFMTNCPCPEWGSQHEAELHDIAGVIAEKYDLLLNINNVNDDVHREIIGGQKLGRHITLKLNARF